LKMISLGLLAIGAMAAATNAAELRIEQFAPASSVIVVSLDGGPKMLEHFRASSASALLEDRAAKMQAESMPVIPGPLGELVGRMTEEGDMLEVIMSIRGGMAFSVQSDPESYAAVPDIVGFVDLGTQSVKMQDPLVELFEELGKEHERVDVSGEECVFIPAPDVAPAGGGGFGPDFSVFADMDSYLLHKDQLILFASSKSGMRRAIEASEGDEVPDSLSESDQWNAISDALTIDGLQMTMLTEHFSELVSLMDSSGMMGMMGGTFVAAIGRVDGIRLGFEPGTGESILRGQGLLWMPEGKDGLIGLMANNTERGPLPNFFETDQLSVGHMNVNFGGVMGWIRSVIQSNPMLSMNMMQGFEQIEPVMKEMMDSLGSGVSLASSLSRPIEADSLHSIYAIECTDTQKFNDAFGMFASDMGMEHREFQGHGIYVMEGGGGMMGGALGMSGSQAIALGGAHVFFGDLKGVEECLRSVGRSSDATLPSGLQAGISAIPSRPLSGWVSSDVFENMQTTMKLQHMQQESSLDVLAEDDPDLAEEIRAELREESGAMREDMKMFAEAFGPVTYVWWATDEAFKFEVNLFGADAGSSSD
jgi:hypothetical protein